MRILVVEDDNETADFISGGLRSAGHVVDCLSDGREGLIQITSCIYDIIVVDRMLPSLDGLSMIKAARNAGIKSPVLFLTALGGVEDRVEALEAGGDDYLVKPFAFSELQARVNALSRRPPLSDEVVTLRVGDLELDLIQRTVHRAGIEIVLQTREFQLLEYMMRNKGRVVSRAMLLERVWDFHFDPKTSVVETLVSRLRAKIDKPFSGEMIRTVRGVGYSLNAPA